MLYVATLKLIKHDERTAKDLRLNFVENPSRADQRCRVVMGLQPGKCARPRSLRRDGNAAGTATFDLIRKTIAIGP